MTRTEHLLIIVAEECVEVAQRASTALRFGLKEVQPGQPFTNADRMLHEVADLIAALALLEDEEAIVLDEDKARTMVEAKKRKIEDFLRYSAECGTLETKTTPKETKP